MTPTSLAWLAKVPPLGFGCCPMGGHGWGKVNDDELVGAVNTALDIGVRLFDTADVYGLGASETLLGQALRGRRDQAVIATKFGVRRENGRTIYDTSPRWIALAAEASLRRLNTDCIDLYQMHYWDRVTPVDDIISALETLRAAGKIRAYGVTNHDPRLFRTREGGGTLATYSYQFSLVHRQYESLVSGIQQDGDLFFMSWGSLGQGVLSGIYNSVEQFDSGDRRRRDAYANFHGERFSSVQKLIEELRCIAAEVGPDGITLTQLVLRWIVDRFPRALPLVGIKRPAQIADAAKILTFKLDQSMCARIDEVSRKFQFIRQE